MLSYKHEDLDLIPRDHIKKTKKELTLIIPLEDVRKGGPGVCQPASLI